MKNYVLIALLGLFLLTSCSNSDDTTDDGDNVLPISELIVAKWTSTGGTDEGCSSVFGYTFKENLTWSIGIFEGCEDVCVGIPSGGTYTIDGDIITSEGGMTEGDALTGRVIIEDDVLTLIDLDTNAVILTLETTDGCL